jgi:hypothetical protein
LEHLPEEENYSHTEVQVTEGGEKATKLGSRLLRKQLREAVADKMLVLDVSERAAVSRYLAAGIAWISKIFSRSAKSI